MRSKYGNRKTMVDNILFDSRDESRYYLYLKGLQAQGIIQDLTLQRKFEILPRFSYHNPEKRGQKRYKQSTSPVCHYIPDFVFFVCKTFSLSAGIYNIPLDAGETVVIDVKGMKTTTYRLKRKMFLHAYPELAFIEVTL